MKERPGFRLNFGYGLLIYLLSGSLVYGQTVNRHLAFGTIISGTTNSILPTDPDAMEVVRGSLVGINLGIEFSLPTHLSRVGGGATMPVSFCITCGRYRLVSLLGTTYKTFNPNDYQTNISIVLLSTLTLYLGGSVSPPLNQRAGEYTGTVIVTYHALL